MFSISDIDYGFGDLYNSTIVNETQRAFDPIKKRRSQSVLIHGGDKALDISYFERSAAQFAKFISGLGFHTALELCCNVGMTSIQMAKFMKMVRGIDNDEGRIEAARQNARLFGVEDKTEFICGNVLDEGLLRRYKNENSIAVYDPGWRKLINGEYKMDNPFAESIDETTPSIREGVQKIRKCVTNNIVVRCPPNFTREMLEELGPCLIQSVVNQEGQLKHKNAFYLPRTNKTAEFQTQFEM